MKVVKSEKKRNSRYFLNRKSDEIQKISAINSSFSKIHNNKSINSSKKTIRFSAPLILKEENIEKIKLKINLINKSPKFLSSKNEIKISNQNELVNLKNNKMISHNNFLKKNSNFLLEKEMENLKEINNNANSDLYNINKIKKIKLSKKNPINLLYNCSLKKPKFKIRYKFVLENILKQKELEFDKKNKISSNTTPLFKKYIEQNSFFRKSKVNRTTLNNYDRNITVSTEMKKNIPSPYSQYLSKTKKIYINLDRTYSFMKNDITYDLLNDKERNLKSQEKMKRLLFKKYDEIEALKDDVTIKNIPIVDNYINNQINQNLKMVQNVTWSVDVLKNLNEDIAFKHRKYFANKYGIELKKANVNIDNTDDYLANYQKSLNG